MSWKSKDIKGLLNKPNIKKALKKSLHGLEREGIRVTKDGKISKNKHPSAFGSPLTNKYISTDFSESQLELITPPFSTEEKTIFFLKEIESYVQKHLRGEYIWSPSMPALLPSKDSDIPLAQYGKSDEGLKKTLYREGLGHRYGRRMQMISGIHYNFSFSQEFWKELHKILKSKLSLQDFISDSYLKIMRNFLRISWLDVYLFGCSPAIDKSYLKPLKTKKSNSQKTLEPPLKKWKKHTYYAPYATSIRMSSFGYCCSDQMELVVSHNSVKEYAEDLEKATLTPYKKYKKIGKKQLNQNYLQIPNEYYSPIRAKQNIKINENILEKLKKNGIKYLEIRSGDLDPFSICGVDIEQMHFFHVLIIYLLTKSDKALTANEQKNCAKNHNKTALFGRKKGLKLIENNREIELKKWGRKELKAMLPMAEILDEIHKTTKYTVNINCQIEKLENPEMTPSSIILKIIKDRKLEFLDFGLQRTLENSKFYKITKIDKGVEDKFKEAAKISLKKKDLLE